MVINAKVQKRLQDGIKKFQNVIKSAKTKDINESDTVVIITDILNEVLGYDKYTEITSEYSIRKTFCDLAIQVNGKLRLLIECKAIGLELKDDFIKQAVDYGSNVGVDWVILTNGDEWKVFKISFSKPIDKELVYEFNFSELSTRNNNHVEFLFYISKEALSKSVLEDVHSMKQALSKFYIGQILLKDEVLNAVKKQLKLLSPDLKVDNDAVRNIIINEVLKREIVEESDKVNDAKKRVNKIAKKPVKKNTIENTKELVGS